MPHRTLQEEERSLWMLFGTFFKIGLFTFGGGYAMIALLENEFITQKHWLGRDEFLDMAAIAESTPGPVAINSATYLGYKLAGVPGAAVGAPRSARATRWRAPPTVSSTPSPATRVRVTPGRISWPSTKPSWGPPSMAITAQPGRPAAPVTTAWTV